jgi:predicted outer membrane repeat protein
MQLKFARAAGRIVAVGALAAAGLGFAQAALAETALAGTPQGAVSVPCSAAALASAIGGASSGETGRIVWRRSLQRRWQRGRGPMTDAAFRHILAGRRGGSIFNKPEDDALIGDDSFTGNFTGKSFKAYGGGIYNESDSMDIAGVTFTGNSSAHGGGFYNETDATLTGTTFTKNRAVFGGGIYNDDDLTVAHSRIATNTATIGGGIYANDDDVTLTRTSVVSNHPDNCEPLNTIAGCTS